MATASRFLRRRSRAPASTLKGRKAGLTRIGNHTQREVLSARKRKTADQLWSRWQGRTTSKPASSHLRSLKSETRIAKIPVILSVTTVTKDELNKRHIEEMKRRPKHILAAKKRAGNQRFKKRSVAQKLQGSGTKPGISSRRFRLGTARQRSGTSYIGAFGRRVPGSYGTGKRR